MSISNLSYLFSYENEEVECAVTKSSVSILCDRRKYEDHFYSCHISVNMLDPIRSCASHRQSHSPRVTDFCQLDRVTAWTQSLVRDDNVN